MTRQLLYGRRLRADASGHEKLYFAESQQALAMPLRKVSGPLVEQTDHKPRESALARLRGRFGARRSADGVRLRGGRRGPVARICLNMFAIVFWLGLIGSVGAGYLAFRLSQGPIFLSAFKERIESALDKRLGQGYRFRFEEAAIENGERGPGIVVSGVVVTDPGGRTILTAPRAEVMVHAPALLIGEVAPIRLELFDLNVRLSVLPDGAFSVSTGNEPVFLSAPAAPAGAGVSDHGEVSRSIAEGLGALIDLVSNRNAILGELKHVGIARGKLTFDDQATGQAVNFDGMEFAFDKGRANAHMALSAQGPNGRWRVEARANGAGPERSLDIDVKDLTFDEISLVAGLRDPPFDFDMPVSMKLRLAVTPEGRLGGSNGSFMLGAGYFFLKDPDHEPLRMDSLHGSFQFDVASHRLILEATEGRSGQTRLAFSGAVSPPRAVGEAWRVDLASLPGSVFGPERAGQILMPLERGSLSARFMPDTQTLVIDRFEALGPQINLGGYVEAFLRDPAQPRLRLGLAVGAMPTTAVMRLWPTPIAPPLRAYLLENLRGGSITGKLALDFDANTFALLKEHVAPPDASMRFDFTISNGALQLLPGVPPLSGAEVSGVATGRTTNLTFSRGAIEGQNGRRLTLADGTFSVPDIEQKPTSTFAFVHLTGPMDAVADILGRDGMKPYGGMQIDSSVMKGQMDAQLNVSLKLGKKAAKGEDPAVRVNATIANLTIDRLVGKEKLDQGSLTVVSDASGLKATGQGRLFGAPATIEMKKPPGGDMEATIGFQLDEAGRSRMGMSFGAGVSGPIGARVTSAFGVKDPPPVQVELDLQRTGLDGVLPGLVKPAGKAAKATFLLDASPRGSVIDQLVFEAPGGPAARGVVELDPAGGFRSARLSQLRISPGDDMKVDADEGKDGVKVTVRGGLIDARPFLKSFFADNSSKDISAGKDLDLDVRAATLAGANRQNLTAVDLKVSRRVGVARNFQLQARAGRASVIGVTTRSASGDPVISISTADGGAFLSFLDFYKRMEGGKFELAARMDPAGIDGSFRVSDFILHDEPALRRLVTEGVAARDERGAIKIDTGAAVFTRMQAAFTRSGGEIAVRDGLLYGTQIGIKLDGSVDFDRDRLNVVGTFVPAYGVNNLFSQIPLFGPILGGASNEGLFAVNFRATGAISAPQLTINPLSAIAPGFLRNLFGAGELLGPGQIPTLPPIDASPPQSAPRR